MHFSISGLASCQIFQLVPFDQGGNGIFLASNFFCGQFHSNTEQGV